MTTFKQQMTLDIPAFANVDEFAELFSYTSPAGVVTTDVLIVPAKQSFVQEYENYAGLGAALAVARSTISSVEIHGKFTDTAGVIYVIQQIFSIDDDFITLTAVADVRISPQGMR